MKKKLPWLITAGTGVIMLVLWAVWGGRVYEAGLVLADINAVDQDSLWKARTGEPQQQRLHYRISGRDRQATLYLPTHASPLAGLVLVPGVVQEGQEHPRLVALAKTLARARFAVLVPELHGFKALQVRPHNVREVADAFAYLGQHAQWAPHGRAGMMAFSYAAGPAFLAALADDIREQVRFIIAIGAYYDVTEVVTFLTTGDFYLEQSWQTLSPNLYGQWVFVANSLDYVRQARDRAVLQRMVELRRADRSADLGALAAALSPEGRTIYALLDNKDRRRIPQLMAELPSLLRADLAALNLADKPLQRLQARVILMADRDDRVIPYNQTLALAQALGPRVSQMHLVNSLMHVAPKGWRFWSWQFWRHDLPDYYKLYAVIYALLGQREAGVIDK